MIQKVMTATLVNFSQKVSDVACGEYHTLCLSEPGVVYACGDNSEG